jgi:hypothetical protein
MAVEARPREQSELGRGAAAVLPARGARGARRAEPSARGGGGGLPTRCQENFLKEEGGHEE